MAKSNLSLYLRDRDNTGILSIEEAWVDRENAFSNDMDDTVGLPVYISSWLEQLLKPHEFRNVSWYMNSKINEFPPENIE